MNADRPEGFHLLGAFDWLIGHNFLITLLIALALTPVGMIVVGLIGELRLVPLNPQKQFLGFIVGDIFLGVAAALLLTAVPRLPSGQWYNVMWVHVVLLVITLGVALVMTLSEIKVRFYPLGAILSPTKLYHNFLLYGGYGYVLVMLALACGTGIVVGIISGTLDWGLVLLFVGALLFAGLWVFCNYLDTVPGFIGQIPQSEKAHHAHIDKWWEAWGRLFGART